MGEINVDCFWINFQKKQQPDFSKLPQFLSKVPFIMPGVIFDQESVVLQFK